MLALLGLAAAQVIGDPPCPNGRLVREVSIPRYAPWCCAGESYVHFEDVSSALMEEMKGKFVTVAPQTDPSLEFPTSAYLISNGMTLQFRHDGNQTWENETAGTMVPYLYLSYSSYPINYPPNEPATASTYYSIGANRDSVIYNAHTNQDGPAVFRIYADECPFPPSPPPPPPTVAMCHEGYWPLYVTEAEAVAVSPLGHADVHPIKGVDFYMPKGFDGALHAEHATFVPVALQDAAALSAALARAPAEPAAAHAAARLAPALRGAGAAASGFHDHRGDAHPVRRGPVHLLAPVVRQLEETGRQDAGAGCGAEKVFQPIGLLDASPLFCLRIVLWVVVARSTCVHWLQISLLQPPD